LEIPFGRNEKKKRERAETSEGLDWKGKSMLCRGVGYFVFVCIFEFRYGRIPLNVGMRMIAR